MPFMHPDVYETDYIEIDGPNGTDIIPCDVVDYVPSAEMTQAAKVEQSEPVGAWVSISYDRLVVIPAELADYTENRTAWNIERKHGWVGRMSAPGYMDCTDWIACDTKREVIEALEEHYGNEEYEP